MGKLYLSEIITMMKASERLTRTAAAKQSLPCLGKLVATLTLQTWPISQASTGALRYYHVYHRQRLDPMN